MGSPLSDGGIVARYGTFAARSGVLLLEIPGDSSEVSPYPDF
jgi:hypothetical protein